ncbi:polysaccharide deacetylase family protein [Cohnella pontilimi]|uniref:Polysaccharide deacetylase family protein n=1 Tax=Cohnella pontilimi TaxID=2564100 RepID=A0A4U0FF75_9BACL|nr:polysaccharide deacetylase family protein [Cohnella pontilimi]TJY43507.1 polysaccharide deacetylase family protein [Cohnella pontilimi]
MEIILWIGFYFFSFYALIPALISRIFGFRVFLRGRTEREIALTFDDGPDPDYTPKLLDLLKRYGAKATFFVVGSHAEQWPEVVARIHREGHVIGIHNYVHHSNWLMRPKTVKKQIERTSEIINRITGVRPHYYRPPWGIVNIFDYRRLGHLQIVLWTSIFGDWRKRMGADRLYRRMRQKLRPGEVFVLHDCGRTFGADIEAPAQTIVALERILQDGQQAGYRFVGVDEMISLTENYQKTRRPDAMAASDSGTEERPKPAELRKPAHRIGPWKKVVVSVWMLWEKLFHVMFRLQKVGDDDKFNFRIRKYTGPAVQLRDNKRLNPGDLVMEMHFENRMLFDMGMSSRSSVHTAIRLIREVEGILPHMARALDYAPNGDRVKALYGVSMIHRGSEGLGFQTFELPRGVFSWMTNLYLRFMLSVINPEGGKRVKDYGERLTARMLIMERDDLLSWKDRTGKQRPSRSARSNVPEAAVSREPGINPDQLGHSM